MRIVGGSLRGRGLEAPKGTATRPTADRIRQALFNILAHHDFGLGEVLENAVVLDAFCGTGALAFEALSRGATQAFLWDIDQSAIKTAHMNAKNLELFNACTISRTDATKPFKATAACTLLFLDPPYHKQLVEKCLPALRQQGWLATHALIVCETAKNEVLQLPSFCAVALERVYGDTKIWIATYQA